MAIVRSLAIGKAVNSAGPITYQTVKGRTIAREKPVHVHNPNTPAQQAQRTKMSNIVAAWRQWFFQVGGYFTEVKGYGSGYNEFVRRNIHLAEKPWFEDFDGELLFMSARARGAYMSTGKYGEGALSRTYDSPNISVEILDLQLRNEVQEGDRIVHIYYMDDPYEFGIVEHYLTEDDVDLLRAGDPVTFEVPQYETAATFFYSSARRIASTGVFK